MNPLITTGLDASRGATALSVNLNRVALLRNSRPLAIPSVARAATLALAAGAARMASPCIRGPISAPSARRDVFELATLLSHGRTPSSTSRATHSTT